MSALEMKRLRDRVEELERILGTDRSTANRLRTAFELTPDQGKMLGMLMARSSVTHESLYAVIYGAKPECDQPEPKIVDVQICKLRARLKPYGFEIGTLWGEGYRLTPAMKAAIRAHMRQVEAALSAPLPTVNDPSDGEIYLGIAH
jgi:hypothetical protein